MQRGDGDAGAGKLGTQTVGVGPDERLGRSVSGLTGEGLEAGGRSDVEDRAASARHHLLHCPGGQIDHGLDVDAHLRDLGCRRRIHHRPDGSVAGVVDQHVDGQAAALDLGEQVGAGGGIGDVAGDHLDADRVTEFGREVAQPFLPAGDQRDAVPSADEFAGKVGADARGRSGDDGGAGRRR